MEWFSQRVIGTELNVAAIILGGIIGLTKKKPLSVATQSFFKNLLGAGTLFIGLQLIWIGVNGSFWQILKQLGIVLVSLIAGKLMGGLLKLQKASNRVGQFARDRMVAARPDNPRRFSDGFKVCAALFCVAPLGIVGPLLDGLSGYFYPLAVKAVMDGMAVMSFVVLFGSGTVLSSIPVLVLQGGITILSSRFLTPLLENQGLIGYVEVTSGFILLCVGLLIFEVRKVHVTDYLPALLLAPLLGWLLS